MEVSTLTDSQLKGSVSAYKRTRKMAEPSALSGSSWSVSVDERDARFKGLEVRLELHLAVLEQAGVEPGRWLTPHEIRFEHRNADVEASVTALANEKVRLLMRWPPEACDEETLRRAPHSHAMQVSTTGDFHEVGTDVALTSIEAFVHGHPDNLRKLATSDAVVKHLFICLDAETSVGVSHSVSRRYAAPPVNGHNYSGLPTRPRQLPEEVDELWVVFEVDGEGWHWGEGRWAQVERGGGGLVGAPHLV
jgi:hypothetical protein